MSEAQPQQGRPIGSDRRQGSDRNGVKREGVEGVKEAGAQVKEQMRQDAQKLKDEAEDVVGAQKSAIAREILGLAQALRTTEQQLEREGKASIAGYTGHAATATERIGQAVEGKRLSELMGDLDALGRQQPMLLLAGSALIGFAATRFLRDVESGVRPDDQGEV